MVTSSFGKKQKLMFKVKIKDALKHLLWQKWSLPEISSYGSCKKRFNCEVNRHSFLTSFPVLTSCAWHGSLCMGHSLLLDSFVVLPNCFEGLGQPHRNPIIYLSFVALFHYATLWKTKEFHQYTVGFPGCGSVMLVDKFSTHIHKVLLVRFILNAGSLYTLPRIGHGAC